MDLEVWEDALTTLGMLRVNEILETLDNVKDLQPALERAIGVRTLEKLQESVSIKPRYLEAVQKSDDGLTVENLATRELLKPIPVIIPAPLEDVDEPRIREEEPSISVPEP